MHKSAQVLQLFATHMIWSFYFTTSMSLWWRKWFPSFSLLTKYTKFVWYYIIVNQAILFAYVKQLSVCNLLHSNSSLSPNSFELGVKNNLLNQVKMQYLQIFNTIDTSIKHVILSQSTAMVKGCMDIHLIW